MTDTAGREATLDKVLALSTLLAADLARFEEAEGLTGARIHLLWQLGVAGPSNQRALAQALGVSPRNITGLVDGLVGSGHVTREPHPSDRRATLVTPTAAGSAFVQRLQDGHTELADQLFGDLAEDRLVDFASTLDETLERLARLMEQPS